MMAHVNPFRSECIEALRYRDATATAGQVLDLCRRQGGRGALVGAKGSGKTTLQNALAERLQEQGTPAYRIRLTEEQRCIDWTALRQAVRGSSPPPVLLDGAEQVRRFAWWKFRWIVRHVGVLIVTTHQAGRLRTLHRHDTSPALLEELVRELLDRQHANPSGDAAAFPLPSRAEMDALFRRHAGNLRECLRDLYNQAAQIH
jgi:energy-coupling factor transporter ATP-binding protein EcfA2